LQSSAKNLELTFEQEKVKRTNRKITRQTRYVENA
jgi:hypothetical protein